MAEIQIERKERSIWPWIVGVLLLVLLIWWAASAMSDDNDIDEAEIAAVEPVPAAPMDAAEQPVQSEVGPIPISEMIATPAAFAGRSVSGTVTVAEVVSDRGFWVEQNGQRLFAVINEPNPEIINMRAGQTVVLDSVQVMTNASQLPGDLDAATRQNIEGAAAFLYVPATGVSISETAQGL